MNEILSSQTFLLTLTLAVYLGSMWLYKKVRFALLHPLIVSMGVLILFLKLSGIPYDLFMKQIQIIDFMLGLSVVALGYLLHEQISQIKSNRPCVRGDGRAPNTGTGSKRRGCPRQGDVRVAPG